MTALRRLDPEELVLGSVLPGHVRDQSGRILIRRGRRLSEEHLEQLQKRAVGAVYAGPDWETPEPPDPPTPVISADELTAILRRRNPPHDDSRARRHRRHPWRVQLRLTIQECSQGVVERRDVVVATCDISAGGFAFVSQLYIHPGTLVYARVRSLPNRPVLKGVVRNCVHLEAREHRVGVEFVPPEEGEMFPPLPLNDS